ncbi:unnamed protein product [Auanema sp. JU1783]|nr:unnamed protein product [Auanema sp. JU1783]
MTAGDEDVAERRSMVGMAPTRRGNATPRRSATNKVAVRSERKRKREESEDESEKNDNDSEVESEEIDDAVVVEKKRKKRKSKLTDSVARKKRSEARKSAAVEKAPPVPDSPEERTPSPESEPEPVIKPPSIRQYTSFQLMCDHLLRKIQSKDPEEFFAFPVTNSMAPDYHTIITQPMDFISMRNKIEEDKYDNIHQMKHDSELIVSNALTYNNPNTVYHLAATRLSTINKYYFSENYIRYIFHTLPFANQVPLEKVGLTPLMPMSHRLGNKNRHAVVDSMKAEDCKRMADSSVRERLATRVPSEIGFMDNKDGATTLNIISDTEKKPIRLIDIVGTLDEGNPGLLSLGDHRLSTVFVMNYLNYGPFCSFAPQYDSTWASLTKKDSDLLLRVYGDRSMVSEVMSLRNMVGDSSEHFIKVVDDMLDTLTDGEHRKAMKVLENKVVPPKGDEPVDDLLNDVETLENLGIDTSFINDIRQSMNVNKNNSIQAQLDQSGQAIMDLHRLQYDRLSKQPPTTLTKSVPPSALEMQLAGNVQQQLVSQVSNHMNPGQLVTPPTIHNALGIEQSGDVDMDLIGEFFLLS